MPTVQQFCQFLEAFAPRRLAEDWDNVGLLVGDRKRPADKVMTCLTVTPESVEEAVAQQAQLIVTHHPVPFRPLKRITTDNVTGSMLLQLVESQIAVYSPHTSFDSASEGINQRLAQGLGIVEPKPLQPFEADPDELGAGRYGKLESPVPLSEFVVRAKELLGLEGLHIVGNDSQTVSRVAVACGSAGQFLQPALRQGCDCLFTGETNFHTCLEAKANGAALVLPGHYASERFALEVLADLLKAEFPDSLVWASAKESDPLQWR